MPSLTLELLAYSNTESQLDLEMADHVHKRIERFTYAQVVGDDSAPIAYLENKELDSRANVHIGDRSWSVPLNSTAQFAARSSIAIVKSTSYTSPFKEVAITNKTYIDESGLRRPLFYRHDLPENTKSCQLRVFTEGNEINVDSGYVLDLDQDAIYTNYQNVFNLDTGAYKIFFVVCTTEDNTVEHTLLNPVPAAKLADWQDIDLTTGRLTTNYPVYSREQSSSGYTFFFNEADTWYIRPLEESQVRVRQPGGIGPKDPWFVRITNGDISARVNGAVRRYYVPEFDRQPFSPSKPIIYSPYTRLDWVNRRVVAASRGSLSVDPSSGLHLNILIYDVNGILQKALTTDTTLEGSRYSSEDIFWESDKILSWDNSSGIIALGMNVHPSWELVGSYFYRADDYEYTLVNLNPLANPDALKYTYVVYAVPDVNSEDRAIHHLVVDGSGIIVYTSQGLGLTHPNLQLKNEDGTFNSSTIIGLKYYSLIESNNFVETYTATFDNAYGYNILAEISVSNIALTENQFDVDVRRPGGIKREKLAEIAERNPKILQSVYGYGEDGQEYPQVNAMVVKAPLTLLTDYGGVLDRPQAERLLKTHYPSFGALIIDWEGPAVEIQRAWSETAEEVLLSWSWLGPNYQYGVYRASSPLGEWTLIHTEAASPPAPGLSHTDIGLDTDSVWYYQVRVIDDDFEYPAPYYVSARVR